MRAIEAYEVQPLVPCVGILAAEPEAAGKSGDTASAIAAHRPDTAVAVIVLHLEVVWSVGLLEGHQAIGTYAETPVAQMGYLLGGKLRGVVPDVKQHKVVARSVIFVKMQFHILDNIRCTLLNRCFRRLWSTY